MEDRKSIISNQDVWCVCSNCVFSGCVFGGCDGCTVCMRRHAMLYTCKFCGMKFLWIH